MVYLTLHKYPRLDIKHGFMSRKSVQRKTLNLTSLVSALHIARVEEGGTGKLDLNKHFITQCGSYAINQALIYCF